MANVQQKRGKSSGRSERKKNDQHISSEAVLSPQNGTFIPRSTIQRTPRKLCTLTLPPPLPSLFDDPSASAETIPSPNQRHKRAPSDLNSTAVSVDPSQITESSHPTPGRHHSGASVTSTDIPSHLRIGMACDPLICYGLVLVATNDGRIAIYQLEDYELDVDEDIRASEQRRRMEWEEDDFEDSSVVLDEEEKKAMDDSVADLGDNVTQRMARRERSKESVAPVTIITLPTQQVSGADSQEDGNLNWQTNFALSMTVGMCATPRGISLMYDDCNTTKHIGHVAVLTDDGSVHVLEFLSRDFSIADRETKHMTGIKNDTIHHYDIPTVKVLCSFKSQFLGATCICMQPIFDLKDSNHYIRSMRLCIGHECGVLECYQLVPSSSPTGPTINKTEDDLSSPYSLAKSKSNEMPRSNSKSNITKDSPKRTTSFLSAHLAAAGDDNADSSFDVATKLFRTYSEPTDQLLISSPSKEQKQCSVLAKTSIDDISVQLCWRGSVHVPIHSITCPGWNPDEAGIKAQYLLALGLMQRFTVENRINGVDRTESKNNNLNLSPAISLEVIDTSLAQKYWLRTKQEEASQSRTHSENIPCVIISLAECSVWPAAGMEVRDGWIRDTSLRKGQRHQQGLRNVSITNKMCNFSKGIPCFVFAASDGTVAVPHLNLDGSWGIHHDYNQIMLPHRCIGMGAICCESSNMLCCCSRGGTIYLMPVIDDRRNMSSLFSHQITKHVVPTDSSGEDDGIVRYVQNFASGIVHVTPWEDPIRNDISSKSVALVGWNGGTIEVYEVSSAGNGHCKALCEQIINRGGAELVEKLLVVNKSHPLISSALWCQAWDECNQTKNLSSVLEGIKDVSIGDFASTRALLMSLIE